MLFLDFSILELNKIQEKLKKYVQAICFFLKKRIFIGSPAGSSGKGMYNLTL